MIFFRQFACKRAECETQVKGFTGAVFKKFSTDSEAKLFILEKTITSNATSAVSRTHIAPFLHLFRRLMADYAQIRRLNQHLSNALNGRCVRSPATRTKRQQRRRPANRASTHERSLAGSGTATMTFPSTPTDSCMSTRTDPARATAKPMQ